MATTDAEHRDTLLPLGKATVTRFVWVHRFLEYMDYETQCDSDPVARLTVVHTKKPWAYLTMRDYSEKRITFEEAQKLLGEQC